MKTDKEAADQIPIMITSDQPSERLERAVRKRLANACLNGKGNYKIRTASGCFNEFITHSPTNK